jgi:hypothetical protein
MDTEKRQIRRQESGLRREDSRWEKSSVRRKKPRGGKGVESPEKTTASRRRTPEGGE